MPVPGSRSPGPGPVSVKSFIQQAQDEAWNQQIWSLIRILLWECGILLGMTIMWSLGRTYEEHSTWQVKTLKALLWLTMLIWINFAAHMAMRRHVQSDHNLDS